MAPASTVNRVYFKFCMNSGRFSVGRLVEFSQFDLTDVHLFYPILELHIRGVWRGTEAHLSADLVASITAK